MKTKWKKEKLGNHIIESKETNGVSDLNGSKVLSVTNIEGFIESDRKTSKDLSKYKKIKGGYFAYNPYRINVGSIALAGTDTKSIVSPAYVVFYTAKDLDSEYLHRFLKSDVGLFHIGMGGKGSVRSSLSFKKLQEIEIPLPPLPEQKRIVKKIKEVEEKIVLYNNAQIVNSESVNQVIGSFWMGVKEIFTKFEWIEDSVSSVCDVPRYGYTAPSTEKDVGPKLLRITDIQNSKVDWANVPYCLCKEEEKNKYLIKKDDILFARTGATTGKSFLVKSPPESVVFASYLIRLRTKKEIISPEYLFHYFQSPYYWKEIFGSQVGTAQPNLNGSKLKKIMVSYPKQKKQQEKIVSFLDHLQSCVGKIKNEQDNIQALTSALLPSILNKAFAGEL